MILLFLPSRLRGRLRYNTVIVGLLDVVFWLVVSLVAFTVLFKCFEKVSWEEAIWQTWQTATTVGYGNRPAETTAGRWTTIFCGTIGIAFLGTGISVMFDLKQNIRDKRRYGMSKNSVKNGYVVINFPGSTELSILAKEIRAQEPEAGICVVDNRIEELPQSLLTSIGNLHFVTGSLLDQETYNEASIKDNKAVIVFPHDPASADSDASTKTIVDSVQRFAGESTRILYILVDPNNAWLFEDSKATPILQTMELFALVQECQDPGIAQSIQLLLKNTEGAIPQTVKLTAFDGWTWRKFKRTFNTVTDSEDIRLDILALVQKGKSILLPFSDTVLGAGDDLQIVAPERIDWAAFANKLVATASSP